MERPSDAARGEENYSSRIHRALADRESASWFCSRRRLLERSPAPTPAPFKRSRQIVAPIALCPDPLVADLHGVYPLEVIQAARFAKSNPNLKGDALNEELKKQTWDDSVKALVGFPQVLEMMDNQLEWMQKLGDAVLAQQKDTMDAIQRLRAKAQSAGNLKSTEQQKVIVEQAEGQPQQQTVVGIEPASPEVSTYRYNPTVVYGGWHIRPILRFYPPYYPVGYFATAAIVRHRCGRRRDLGRVQLGRRQRHRREPAEQLQQEREPRGQGQPAHFRPGRRSPWRPGVVATQPRAPEGRPVP
jgi:hypothetical protein